jgi:hypothetical protein
LQSFRFQTVFDSTPSLKNQYITWQVAMSNDITREKKLMIGGKD